MSKTNYLENNLINHVLRGVVFPPPISIYLSLYTTAPTVAGGGIEVSGGSYARQQCFWVAPSLGTTTNTADILFPVATAIWGTVTSFALMDAVAGGNMLYFANLNAPRTIQVNDQLKFPINQLTLVET